MTPDPLPIALRAWTERAQPVTRPTPSNGPAVPVPTWPTYALLFDTETTTDAAQRLLFGSYRLCKWTPGRTLTLLEEGLFHAEDLPESDPSGFDVLTRYVRTLVSDGARRAGKRSRLRLLPASAFVERVFLPLACQAEALIVGFNLPFDLTRLAVRIGNARGRYRGGFSLTLAHRHDPDAGPGEENRFRPRVCYKVIDSKRALIGLTGGRDYRRPGVRGRFLDLKTLAFALTGQGYSLERACVDFGVAHGKLTAAEHGRITPDYVEYNRRDVLATQELLERLRTEFDRHPITLDPCHAMSSASLAKGYLAAMGVAPPREQCRNLPVEIHAAAMMSYYGGRAECRIRRVSVPVVHTDFL